MSNIDKLGLTSSEAYDRGYKQAIADIAAGKPYDVDNECAMESTSQYVDTSSLHVTTGAVVDRFLCWKLPKTFAPDAGISFKPSPAQQYDGPQWPVGTNLLTADEAKQMFMHCLAPVPVKVAETPCRCHKCINFLDIPVPELPLEEKQAMFDKILKGPNGRRRVVHIALQAYHEDYARGQRELAMYLEKWPEKQEIVAEVEQLHKLK